MIGKFYPYNIKQETNSTLRMKVRISEHFWKTRLLSEMCLELDKVIRNYGYTCSWDAGGNRPIKSNGNDCSGCTFGFNGDDNLSEDLWFVVEELK